MVVLRLYSVSRQTPYGRPLELALYQDHLPGPPVALCRLYRTSSRSCGPLPYAGHLCLVPLSSNPGTPLRTTTGGLAAYVGGLGPLYNREASSNSHYPNSVPVSRTY